MLFFIHLVPIAGDTSPFLFLGVSVSAVCGCGVFCARLCCFAGEFREENADVGGKGAGFPRMIVRRGSFRYRNVTEMKVCLVGCGNIGADLCIALQRGGIPARIVALNDVAEKRARLLLRTFRLDARICPLDEAVSLADFVAECASGGAVKDVLEAAIRHRKPCLIMSVGGLLDEAALLETARQKGVHVRVPSGAICGLDGIRSAMEAGLHRVTLTTRKPLRGLSGAPYLIEKGIDVEKLTEPLEVFSGTALEAVKAFPQNVNVAAALSLMGIGPKETQVRVIADPNATTNIHEIVAEGAFGRLTTITENLPSPRNAKSSYLASLSACAELRAAAEAFVSRS